MGKTHSFDYEGLEDHKKKISSPERIKKFREKQLKKRYNVTLDKADSEELQILLGCGLSPALQFVTDDFLESMKDEMEQADQWEEEPLTSEERKVLDEAYKNDDEGRWADLSNLAEMKKRRIERGRYFLIKKEALSRKIKKIKNKEGGKH